VTTPKSRDVGNYDDPTPPSPAEQEALDEAARYSDRPGLNPLLVAYRMGWADCEDGREERGMTSDRGTTSGEAG
jgi:hypothetical protein